MATALDRVRELRYLTGTTFNLTHTAPDAAAWDIGTSTKLRILSLDLGGLDYSAEDDPTLEGQQHAGRPPIPTTRGPVEVKFGAWAEGGQSDGTANPMATLMSKGTGGLQAGAATDAADSSGVHTTTKIYANGIESSVAPGQGVMVGAFGDGDGEAEVRVVSAEGANYFEVPMAYAGAVQDAAQIRICTTVFFDPTATQNYVDLVAIGKSAEDQIQTIGGAVQFGLENLNPGQAPRLAFTVKAADWQEVASGDRATIDPDATPSGNAPATLRGLGQLCIGDNGSTTRAAYKLAEISIDPGFEYVPVPGANGINGIEAWQLVINKPTITATLLLEGGTDPLPGFYDDFVAGTYKQIFWQAGKTAQKTFAVDMPRAYFAKPPKHKASGQFAAVEIVLVGTTAPMAAESTANYLLYSPMRWHFC